MQTTTRNRTGAMLVAIGLACGVTAFGAPKEPPAKPLALKKVAGLTNGRLAYVVGTTAPDGSRYYASNLLVTQPVLVTVKADDPKDEIQLRVTKTQWSKTEREVSTGAAGRVQVAFRTQGEFGLAVSGAGAGKPYRMTVWIGDEVKRPMPLVVVPKSKWKPGPAAAAVADSGRTAAQPGATAGAPGDSTSSGGSLAIWLIAGMLVVIAGLLFALLRKKAGVVVLVCGVTGLAPATASAQTMEAIGRAMLSEELGKQLEEGVETGTKLGGDLVHIYETWEEFSDAHDALTPDDRQFDPDYSPPGSPEIPSACAESEECKACYDKAVKDINFYRFSLDKGQGIARGTLDYAKKAIAFGDTASASFGVGGLAWSLDAKPDIEKVTTRLRKTYKSKYEEWIAGLEASLQELGKCEEEHFNERDWYGRFGYIYYSFMADRYKSPD